VRGPGLRSGGYLIGPGSVVGGIRYVVERDLPVAALPGWIASRLTPEAAVTSGRHRLHRPPRPTVVLPLARTPLPAQHLPQPRAHADHACLHEDRIVPAHIKGRANKPLKIGETVNLWDHQPEEG
jgi:hypothetical protein